MSDNTDVGDRLQSFYHEYECGECGAEWKSPSNANGTLCMSCGQGKLREVDE